MLSKLLYSLFPCLRKEEEDAHGYFLHNGSKLLEDLIASCDGKSNPIRHYSAQELIRATNNFDYVNIVGQHEHFTEFRGFLDNRSVIIKRMGGRDQAIRDIIISMQMSAHKNVLKLLGCCLEFPAPALVHEYAARCLNTEGGLGGPGRFESLPWKTRLCIAKQVANAITYLHTAFPRLIIHRNLKPTHIFLDDDYVPKISDFSLSITIPPEQSYVEDDTHVVEGTFMYVDPAYLTSSRLTEKTDVYSFGVILLVFLSGRNPLHRNQAVEFYLVLYEVLHASDDQFLTIVDPKILEEIKGEDEQPQQQQLHDFLALALLCTRREPERRPDMIDVAKQLVRIEKSINPC